MMYKLILVASAVNAAEHENTSALVGNLCGLVDMMPDAVPMAAVSLLKTYGPTEVSEHFKSVKDTKLANKMVLTGCECFKKGRSLTECFYDEAILLKTEAPKMIAEKGAAIAFGDDSVVAQSAGSLMQAYTEGSLENPVQRAKAFVDFIVDAESNNAAVSFRNIMGKTEADNLTAKLKLAQAELKKAVEVEKRESFSCTEPLYKALEEIVKDGLYDEVLARSHDVLGTKTKDDDSADITSMLKKLAVRTGVSKTISFLDTCSSARILLA